MKLCIGLLIFVSFSGAVMAETKQAAFAAGCFWCIQPPYDKQAGVISTSVGFAGGKEKNPTYKDVAYGKTSHTEAILVKYDSEKVSYQELIDIFWKNVDPFDANGQFCDRGQQYRPAIFFYDDQQKEIANATKKKHEESLGKKIVVEILPIKEFYAAEDSHQKFYKKNPIHYKTYRLGCGRDKRLKAIWND